MFQPTTVFIRIPSAAVPRLLAGVRARTHAHGMMRLLAGVGAALLAGGQAQAQIGGSSAHFNSGYNGAGSMNAPINVGTTDANNNQVFINGVMQAPQGSIFSSASGVSQSSTSGGVGGTGLATAVGNSLNVVVEGSYNRVTVDSRQINNGDVSANVSLNGQIKLDGQ
jgi:holdfast attachment protein HfaA